MSDCRFGVSPVTILILILMQCIRSCMENSWKKWTFSLPSLRNCMQFAGTWFSARRSEYVFRITHQLEMLHKHTCEPLLMDMREIWFSFQGDWGLHQGDYSTAFLTHRFKLFSIKSERIVKKYMNYSTLCFKFTLKLSKISTKYIKTERVQCN